MTADPALTRPLLLVLTGPSGVGKTTLCERLLKEYRDRLARVVTATTRAPRPGEKNARDYHFLTREEFDARVARELFIEHAEVHSNGYGTPLESVRAPLQAGQDILLSIDVQGAASVRQRALEDTVLARSLVTIFVMPPAPEALLERLRSRGTDVEEVIQRRIETARDEMSHWADFDYCIISADRTSDFRRFEAIYLAEKCKVATT